MVLELTTHVHSMCAQTDATCAPELFRLAQGRVGRVDACARRNPPHYTLSNDGDKTNRTYPKIEAVRGK